MTTFKEIAEGSTGHPYELIGTCEEVMLMMLADEGLDLPDEHEVAYHFRRPVDYDAILVAWARGEAFEKWQIDHLSYRRFGLWTEATTDDEVLA